MSFLRLRFPSLYRPATITQVWVKVSPGIYVKGVFWIKVDGIYVMGTVSVKISGVYQL